MGNKRSRRSKRTESQSSDRDENTSETSFTQGNATLVSVSENAGHIFDRNLDFELTALSQVSNEIEVIPKIFAAQNNTKMTQIEEQLNSKIGEILKEIRVKRNSHIRSDEEDAEDNKPGPSKFENRTLRKKHASNMAIDRDKSQDDCFQSAEMCELRQP